MSDHGLYVVTIEADTWPFMTPLLGRAPHEYLHFPGRIEYGLRGQFKAAGWSRNDNTIGPNHVSLAPGYVSGEVWFRDIRADTPLRLFVATEEDPETSLSEPLEIVLEQDEWITIQFEVDRRSYDGSEIVRFKPKSSDR